MRKKRIGTAKWMHDQATIIPVYPNMDTGQLMLSYTAGLKPTDSVTTKPDTYFSVIPIDGKGVVYYRVTIVNANKDAEPFLGNNAESVVNGKGPGLIVMAKYVPIRKRDDYDNPYVISESPIVPNIENGIGTEWDIVLNSIALNDPITPKSVYKLHAKNRYSWSVELGSDRWQPIGITRPVSGYASVVAFMQNPTESRRREFEDKGLGIFYNFANWVREYAREGKDLYNLAQTVAEALALKQEILLGSEEFLLQDLGAGEDTGAITKLFEDAEMTRLGLGVPNGVDKLERILSL